MKKLSYSHVVISCQKTLEFGPDGKGGFHTTCPSVYECHGCNGEFYVPPPDPRTLVLVEKFSPHNWKRDHDRLTGDSKVALSGYPADIQRITSSTWTRLRS